jgi:hypothetical protein
MALFMVSPTRNSRSATLAAGINVSVTAIALL